MQEQERRDKMELELVPTLHPTEEEFASPIRYLSSAEVAAVGNKYGMIKIKPPSSFKPPFAINQNKFRFTPRIQKLKELNIMNRCRLFFTKQMNNFYEMTGNGAQKATNSHGFETVEGVEVYFYDVFIDLVKYFGKPGDASDRVPVIDRGTVRDSKVWDHLASKYGVRAGALRQVYETRMAGYVDFLSGKPQFLNLKDEFPNSLLHDESGSEEEEEEPAEDASDRCLVCHKHELDPLEPLEQEEEQEEQDDTMLICDSCDKYFHLQCLHMTRAQIPEHSWYCANCVLGNGYYGFQDAREMFTLGEFQQQCEQFDAAFFGPEKPASAVELESQFWQLVDDMGNNVKVQYGADIHNRARGQVSGFPIAGDFVPAAADKASLNQYVRHAMNLNKLPFSEGSLLRHLQADISGMTIPWIYVGSTFSTFCWHVEDQFTLSANYQHFGATKKWYSIPQQFADRFESYMRDLAPDLFAKQPDILHQLVTLVSPFELRSSGIQCYTAEQNPGEYIITYPRVYHAGFNTGFNFNEAVNFTMSQWVPYGISASSKYRLERNKVSVFDVWKLVIGVVQESDDQPLVEYCVRVLRSRLVDELQLANSVRQLLDCKPVQHVFSHKILNVEDDRDLDNEGVICSQCQGHCTFHYVLRARTGHRSPRNQLPTPNATPKRRSKRIKLQDQFDVYCLDDYLKRGGSPGDVFYKVFDLQQALDLVS